MMKTLKQREEEARENQPKKNPRIEKGSCKYCGNTKLWIGRGSHKPHYILKCTKCWGYQDD